MIADLMVEMNEENHEHLDADAAQIAAQQQAQVSSSDPLTQRELSTLYNRGDDTSSEVTVEGASAQYGNDSAVIANEELSPENMAQDNVRVSSPKVQIRQQIEGNALGSMSNTPHADLLRSMMNPPRVQDRSQALTLQPELGGTVRPSDITEQTMTPPPSKTPRSRRTASVHLPDVEGHVGTPNLPSEPVEAAHLQMPAYKQLSDGDPGFVNSSQREARKGPMLAEQSLAKSAEVATHAGPSPSLNVTAPATQDVFSSNMSYPQDMGSTNKPISSPSRPRFEGALNLSSPLSSPIVKKISSPDANVSYATRNAIRLVITDPSTSTIFVTKSTREDGCRLPGGGVEGLEDHLLTARDIGLREIGHEVTIQEGYFAIVEDWMDNLHHVTYCYAATLLRDRGEVALPDNDKVNGLENEWMSLEEAVSKIEASQPMTDMGKSVRELDLFLVNAWRSCW